MLEPNEHIEQIIQHKNYLPFRLEDWYRVPVYLLVIGLAIYILVTEGTGLSFIFILPITVGASYFGIYMLLKRWPAVRQVEYIVTDQRLIIWNKKKREVQHSFPFTDFPRMSLRENAYNFGFIILGEPAPLIVTTIDFLRIRTGFNGRDFDVVIENLPEVRKVYNMLREKVGKPARNYR